MSKGSKVSNSMKNITLSEKLILYFLLLGLGTICIISIYSYYSTQEALMNRTFDQLTSLKIAKKNQVEIFFRDRIKEVTLLAGSDETRKIAETLDKATEAQRTQELSSYMEKFKSLTGYFTSVMIISQKNKFVKGYTAGQAIEEGIEKQTINSNPGNSHLLLQEKVPGNEVHRRTDQEKATGDEVYRLSVIIRDETIDPSSGKVKMIIEAAVLNADKKPCGSIII
jgi:hypothetical protein